MGRHSGFGRPPAKGTKLRDVAILLLRQQGATNAEILATYGTDYDSRTGNARHAYRTIETLREQKGYDIRTFPLSPDDPRHAGFHEVGTVGRRPVIHKMIGKMRWDGSYRSFIDPKLNRGRLRRKK